MKQPLRPYILYKVYALLALALLTATAVQAQSAAGIRRQGTTCRPVGSDIVLKTTFVLDSLSLKSNRQLVVTPLLEGKDGRMATFRPVMVNGRRQHIWYQRNGSQRYAGATEVQRTKGKAQSLSYLDSLPYEPWMDGAALRFATDTCGCGDLLASDPGDSRLLNFHPETGLVMAFLSPEAGPDPIVSVTGKAYLDYPVNRTELYPDYRNNPRELEKIIETINKVRRDSNVTITAIDIHGYASPEGSWDNNVRLSVGRAATLKSYVSRLMKFPESVFTVHNTPEDWDGLDSFLVASNLENRDAILQVVRDQSLEPDPRNEKIKSTWPEQYKFILETWYPALRHSDYTVQYKIRTMSDQQAATLLHTQPELLSQNKLFRIANLYAPGSDEFNEVFGIAVRLYPSDPTANLNAACIALNLRELDRAEAYLRKAGDSPQATHARGVLALLQGRLTDAETLLTEARDVGIAEAATNLSILRQMREHTLD
ncbi:MAG: DUF3868 domain-containing protein [Bacteroidaceae bacterium]|nr:DUF3868 domain-containing protein [Bacteroidaceae bacterium]